MRSSIVLDIARVVALVHQVLGIFLAPLFLRVIGRKADPFRVRLRRALEDLGLTYLKLGQYLSTRFDVLPGEVCQELEKLLENVRPVPIDELKVVIESELDSPLASLFSRFERNPIASASVAQVHEAWTLGGERVAVKIQRPGIERIFAADVRNMRRAAMFADMFGLLGRISTREMVDEFAAWTTRELDFCTEGRAADHLREAAIPGEIIPHVYWNLTARRVLTLEFVDGVSLARVVALVENDRTDEVDALLPALDIQRIGHLMATACLRQFFVTGFFHGDPHPGNILVLRDNSFAFVDFGIVGNLGPYLREALMKCLENLAVGNIDASFRYYTRQLILSEDSDMERFADEAKQVLRRWFEASRDPLATTSDRHLAKYSSEMLAIIRRHRIGMSSDSLLFWRAMNALASTAIRLPEHFDILGEMAMFFAANRPDASKEVLAVLSDPMRWMQSVDAAKLATKAFHDFPSRDRTWYGLYLDWSTTTERAQNCALAPVIAAVLVVAVVLWITAVVQQ